MTTARTWARCVAGVAVVACLLGPARADAQTLADRLAPLALDPEGAASAGSGLQCATPPDPMPWLSGAFAADPSRANVAGEMEPLADGRPLYADQVPRFLHPNHEGTFGFDRFLVLGDYETVTFERLDGDAESHHTVETWLRTGTDAVSGRLVSVFSPVWDSGALHKVLRRYSWGVDAPSLYWGRLVVPGSAAADEASTESEESVEHDHVNVYLAIVPPNIPASPVVRIDDRVQYASHAVNIVDADFGDSRVLGGDTALNLPEITGLFYEHFADENEVIAVVSQAMQLGGYTGFHHVVRNDIDGIGLELFDQSATYGSAGVLQAVEGYPPGGWASWATVLHEQGHQYGEYTEAWGQVGPAEPTAPPGMSVIDRLGFAPDVHTPLLTPGAVAYGAVLEGHVRVGRDLAEDGQPGPFRIERNLPRVGYHPLTLYRMGLLPAADLPSVHVFLDQGQFDAESSSAPEPGTAVSGGTIEVTVNDLMAADGVRSGPPVTSVRRAVVYVSRSGLAPQSEMDVVNYFARRLGESSGVTSWDRYPSFWEATGGLAAMATDIRRKPEALAPVLAAGPSVRCAKVGTDALVGIQLDEEFGGCLNAGTTVDVSGVLTLAGRSAYYAVCLRFLRYGAPHGDRVYECDELNVDRFALSVTFPEDEPGGYTMEAFAFWPESVAQLPLTIYTGAVEVLPSGSPVAPSTAP